jgi:hypothetical protein
MRVVYYESRKRELKKRRKKDVMRVSAMRWKKWLYRDPRCFFFTLKKSNLPRDRPPFRYVRSRKIRRDRKGARLLAEGAQWQETSGGLTWGGEDRLKRYAWTVARVCWGFSNIVQRLAVLRDLFNPTGQAAGLNTCQGILRHAYCMNVHDVGSCPRASLFDLHIFLKCCWNVGCFIVSRQDVRQTERHSWAPRGLRASPWLFIEHMDQHLQEQGSYWLLRAAVRGTILQVGLSCHAYC